MIGFLKAEMHDCDGGLLNFLERRVACLSEPTVVHTKYAARRGVRQSGGNEALQLQIGSCGNDRSIFTSTAAMALWNYWSFPYNMNVLLAPPLGLLVSPQSVHGYCLCVRQALLIIFGLLYNCSGIQLSLSLSLYPILQQCFQTP